MLGVVEAMKTTMEGNALRALTRVCRRFEVDANVEKRATYLFNKATEGLGSYTPLELRKILFAFAAISIFFSSKESSTRDGDDSDYLSIKEIVNEFRMLRLGNAEIPVLTVKRVFRTLKTFNQRVFNRQQE